MKKFLKHEGNMYEGIFLPLPGKQNFGHLMINGNILYNKTKNGEQGEAVEFSSGRADEVHVNEKKFFGFFNLDETLKIGGSKQKKDNKVSKPIKLNKREDIQAMSKDAEEIILAIKKHAVDGIVYLKDIEGVNPNKLYGHLTNLVNAKIVKRIGKDKKRGTKIKILR